MRKISIFDTKTSKLQPLDPRDPGRVGIYACGPTVYSRIHVGNARPFVLFSLLKRFLEHEGYKVNLVINITDINDKIYTAAKAADMPSDELAAKMAAHYISDTDRLGLGRPDHEPLASEMLTPIVQLIGALIERGHAYVSDGDVYFSVRSLPSYGELSHRDLEQMDQGEGIEGAQRKRDPLDFALWKAQKPEEDTAWDAPWGKGRPGWHIECSAMAEELLGPGFDIHGGGVDLIFPHHENEDAQTLAGRGKPLARLWMHNGMIEIDREPEAEAAGASGPSATQQPDNENTFAEKMSKSVGNIRGLGDVLDQVGRDALVLYFCSGRYRQPLAFSRDRLESAARSVSRIREAVRKTVPGDSPEEFNQFRDTFFDALANDFNTADALAALYDWINKANKQQSTVGDSHLREMLWVLGLDNLLAEEAGPPPEIIELAKQRDQARAQRDFSEADRLRDEISAKGWEARDSAEGTKLVRASSASKS